MLIHRVGSTLKTLTKTTAVTVLAMKVAPAVLIGSLNAVAGVLAARILLVAFAPLSFLLVALATIAEQKTPGSREDDAGSVSAAR